MFFQRMSVNIMQTKRGHIPVYSLAEFREPEGNKIRKDRSFEKDYINGRYGAIPYIKD